MFSIFVTRTLSDPLRKAVGECRQHLVQAAIFSGLLNLLFLAPAIYMLQIYDRVVPTRGMQTFLMLTIIYVFAVVTLGALDWLRSCLLIRSAARLDRLLAGEILSALLAPMDRMQSRTGAVLREFDSFRQTVTGPSAVALFDLPWFPIYIFVCFALHPAIGLFALTCAAVLLSLALLHERAMGPALAQAMSAQQQSYQSIEETLRSGDIVRTLGMQNGLIARHLRGREAATATQARTAFISARFVTTTKTARIAMQSFALGLGALLAIEQKISSGAIFAAALLVSRALAPLENVTTAWRNIVQARMAIKGLNAAFDQRASLRDVTLLPNPQGRITIENLGVRLPGHDRDILQDISAQIEPGEMIGIVGPSGAGKSTLLRAIAGELAPDAGEVRLDGASLAHWRPDQLARSLGYVPQTTSLLGGSIKDNISRFKSAVGPESAAVDAEVVRVAKMCKAHDFILRLPNAYETPLQAGGVGLSVGQAQRVALARALYGKPSVLLLDEPNAHLDFEGESQLIALLKDLKDAKVTVLVAAHRMRLLEGSDKLLLLRAGKMVAFGPSKEIMTRFTPPPDAKVQQTVGVAV